MTGSRSQKGRWASNPLLPGALLIVSALILIALSANQWYSPAACPRGLRQLPTTQRGLEDATAARHDVARGEAAASSDQPQGGRSTPATAAAGWQQQQDGSSSGGDGGSEPALAGSTTQGDTPVSSQQQRKPNVALTVVSGDLHQNWTSVFIRSWRRHSPSTRVVVFVDAVAAAKQAVLRDFGAELVPFEMPRDTFIVAHRFRLWLDWLKAHGDEVGGVMLTDARDVYLQADPWQDPAVQQLLADDAVLFTLEGGRAIGDLLIGQQAQNQKWASKCFAPGIYGELERKPISCAGVTLGSPGAVRKYIEEMFRAWDQDALRACKKITGDQAVHNYLLHYLGPKGRLPFKYRALSNWQSPVATATYGWPMRVDAYGRLQRPNATFPAIVHQYDRSSKLRLLMFQQYPVVPEMEWPPPECDRGLLGVPGIRTCEKGEKGYAPGQI